MFELKPDYEEVLGRFEGWWNGTVVDRPLVSLAFERPSGERIPLPQADHPSLRDRWLDTEYQARLTEARLRNTVHFADALPIAWPNLGPEVFSAFYGCEMEYEETTAWSKPILEDWSETSLASLQLDRQNPYFLKLQEMTDALLAVGRGHRWGHRCQPA